MKSITSYRRDLLLLAAPLILALSLAGLSNQAHAATIQWTINNGVFDDGGTVNGSFLWDTDTNDLVSWNLSVSGGDTATFSEITYSNTLPLNVGADLLDGNGDPFLIFRDDTPNAFDRIRDLRFSFPDLNALNTPGIIMLAINVTGVAGQFGLIECFNCSPRRQGLDGAYLSSVVPVPAAIWLFGSALVGFIGFSRRTNVT